MNLKALDEAVEKLRDVYIAGPKREEEIRQAEKELGLAFSEDYRYYLLTYGRVCSLPDGLDLTGLISQKNFFDVVIATLAERDCDDDFPKDAYVVHNWGYDGIVAIQYANGEIYARGSGYETEKMNDSLAEYIEEGMQIRRENEAEED